MTGARRIDIYKAWPFIATQSKSMSAITIRQMADRVAGLLDDRLQAPGSDLAAKLARVRRQLPRRVYEAAARLSQATVAANNPKLMVRINEGVLAEDFDVCVRHLTAIPPGTGFLRGVVRVAVSVAVGLCVLALAFWLWRGTL
jgi:hypothetical protein